MSNRTASTSSVQLFLQSFDDAWSHKLESILAVLKDVTPDESIWQHPAYAGEKHMLGLPAPGTVLWQIAHLEHCARHYAQIVRVHRSVRSRKRRHHRRLICQSCLWRWTVPTTSYVKLSLSCPMLTSTALAY
jgi:hypothetical protein